MFEGIQDTLKYSDQYGVPELRSKIIEYAEEDRQMTGPEMKLGSQVGLRGLSMTDATVRMLYNAATHSKRQEAAKRT